MKEGECILHFLGLYGLRSLLDFETNAKDAICVCVFVE